MYKYTEKCREISGMGGGYEDACRKMVIAGMLWFDEHPEQSHNFQDIEVYMGLLMKITKMQRAYPMQL